MSDSSRLIEDFLAVDSVREMVLNEHPTIGERI